MRPTETLTLEGTVLDTTALAVLIDVDGDEIWLPRSRVTFDPAKPDEGDTIRAIVPEWLAKNEGLI